MHLGLDPGKEKGHWLKTNKIGIKYGLLITKYQYWFIGVIDVS